MTKSERFSVLIACAMPLALGASCADDTEPSSEPHASIAEAQPDAGSEPSAEPQVQIEGVTTNGQGCPEASWAQVATSNGAAIALSFEKYTLSLESSERSIKQLPCTVTLRVRTPKGRSVALRSLEFEGEAQLAPSAKGAFLIDTAWTGIGVGGGRTGRVDIQTSGPFKYRYEAEALNWASCDITSSLQLRTRLTLDSAGGKSEIRLLGIRSADFVTAPCPGSTSDDAPDDSAPLTPGAAFDAGTRS